MISHETGDFIIMLLQFGFGAMLIPTILNRHAQVPRMSSVPTAAGLWMMAATFYAMGSTWPATIGTAVCAIAWTIVAMYRSVIAWPGGRR